MLPWGMEYIHLTYIIEDKLITFNDSDRLKLLDYRLSPKMYVSSVAPISKERTDILLIQLHELQLHEDIIMSFDEWFNLKEEFLTQTLSKYNDILGENIFKKYPRFSLLVKEAFDVNDMKSTKILLDFGADVIDLVSIVDSMISSISVLIQRKKVFKSIENDLEKLIKLFIEYDDDDLSDKLLTELEYMVRGALVDGMGLNVSDSYNMEHEIGDNSWNSADREIKVCDLKIDTILKFVNRVADSPDIFEPPVQWGSIETLEILKKDLNDKGDAAVIAMQMTRVSKILLFGKVVDNYFFYQLNMKETLQQHSDFLKLYLDYCPINYDDIVDRLEARFEFSLLESTEPILYRAFELISSLVKEIILTKKVSTEPDYIGFDIAVGQIIDALLKEHEELTKSFPKFRRPEKPEFSEILMRTHSYNNIIGPISLYYFKIPCLDKTFKKILLFGDEHTPLNEFCYDCIYYDQFINLIIDICKHNNNCVDLYLETHLMDFQLGESDRQVTREMKGGSTINSQVPTAIEDTLNYMRRMFKECGNNNYGEAMAADVSSRQGIDYCLVNGIQINNLRVHNIDFRLTNTIDLENDGSLSTESGLNDMFYLFEHIRLSDKSNYIKIIKYILGYDIDEAEEAEIIYLFKDIAKWVVDGDGTFDTAHRASGWQCAICNKQNKPYTPKCMECGRPRPSTEDFPPHELRSSMYREKPNYFVEAVLAGDRLGDTLINRALSTLRFIRRKINKEYSKLKTSSCYIGDLRKIYFDTIMEEYTSNWHWARLAQARALEEGPDVDIESFHLIDFYTLLRMFIDFDIKGAKSQRSPQLCRDKEQQNRIIAYTGDAHTRNYVRNLKKLGAQHLVFSVSSKDFFTESKVLKFDSAEINKGFSSYDDIIDDFISD